jgi:hypothetical protein
MRHPSASEMTLGFMQSTLVAGQFGALPEQKQNALLSMSVNCLRIMLTTRDSLRRWKTTF